MVYDPKKKRPQNKELDSVVDEIFGDEKPKPKKQGLPASSQAKKKKAENVKARTSSETTSRSSAKNKQNQQKKPPVSTHGEENHAEKIVDEPVHDNIVSLYPEVPETPLVLQPQVWIATGLAALALLLFIKRRKKH